jgi:hypothetical protein
MFRSEQERGKIFGKQSVKPSDSDIMTLMLRNPYFDIRINGKILFICACSREYTDCVEYSVEHNADIHARDDCALSQASYTGHSKIFSRSPYLRCGAKARILKL